jgi:hypothetical protein
MQLFLEELRSILVDGQLPEDGSVKQLYQKYPRVRIGIRRALIFLNLST